MRISDWSSDVCSSDLAEFRRVIIAYEPVWAIGTGLTASPEQAQEMHAFIRNEIASVYEPGVAEETSLLYGGSCNPKNAPELRSEERRVGKECVSTCRTRG